MSSPLELMRCRSILKEDFILEESRPSELTSSNPASSTSSLSSSSPRDSNTGTFSRSSRRPDPSFTSPDEKQEKNFSSKIHSSDLQTQKMGELNLNNLDSNQITIPVIREPERRIRRKSENSSSTENFRNPHLDQMNKTDTALILQAGKGLIMRSQRMDRKYSKKDSSLNISRSMENLSPQFETGSTLLEQKFLGESRHHKIPVTFSQSVANSVKQKQMPQSPGELKGSCSKSPSEKTTKNQTEENLPNGIKSQAAPFSGKARIIASTDMDQWDNLNFSRDENNTDPIFVPFKSSNEPQRSIPQNAKEISKVTKSHADALHKNKNEFQKLEERPKTSTVEKKTAIKNELSSRDAIAKAKNIQEKNSPINETQLKNKSTVNTKSNNNNISQKTQKTPVVSEYDISNAKDVDTGCFIIAEESVRLGSASKIRLQDKLAALKQKRMTAAQTEKEYSKTKKGEEGNATTTKSQSVSRAAQLERFIKKHQTQNSVVRKSVGSQNVLKNDKSVPTTNKKLSSSSETAIGGLTKTFSTGAPNVFTKSQGPPTKSSQKGMSSTAGSSQQKNSLSKLESQASVQVKDNKPSGVESLSVSGAEKAKTTSQTYPTSLTKDKGVVKAMDPHIILTPRSTEPLVKIKYKSSSPLQNTDLPSSTSQKHAQTVITTPLIVNPYEEFSHPQNSNMTSDLSTRDAIVKLRKPLQKGCTSSNKSVKKTSTNNKRPNSGTSRKTTSAGKKRGSKSKDSKEETEKDGRVRSGKRRSKQIKKKSEPETTETELTAAVENSDVALISGIGWQLSTSCVDTSEVTVTKSVNFKLTHSGLEIAGSSDFETEQNLTDDGDEDEISEKEDFAVENGASNNQTVLQYSLQDQKSSGLDNLEIFKEKITLNSPRFLEMKRRQESQINFDLPVVTNDGFPPMNLDLTQRNTEISNANHEPKSSHSNIVQREMLIDKLTPIPEASFVSKTVNAISQFDKSMQGDKLSELLENSFTQEDKNVYRKSARKSLKQSSGVDNTSEVKTEDAVRNYEYTSSGKAIRRVQSMRETKKDNKIPRVRKFSETKSMENDEDNTNIDEAIDEILSTSISSNASTLKGVSQNPSISHNYAAQSHSHTLTEGDKKLLLKLQNSNNNSPFHARSANVLARSSESPLPFHDIIPDVSTTTPRGMTYKHTDSLKENSTLTNMLKKSQPISSNEHKLSTPRDNSVALSSSLDILRKPPLSSRSSLNQNRNPKSPLKRASSMREARAKVKDHENDLKVGYCLFFVKFLFVFWSKFKNAYNSRSFVKKRHSYKSFVKIEIETFIFFT